MAAAAYNNINNYCDNTNKLRRRRRSTTTNNDQCVQRQQQQQQQHPSQRVVQQAYVRRIALLTIIIIISAYGSCCCGGSVVVVSAWTAIPTIVVFGGGGGDHHPRFCCNNYGTLQLRYYRPRTRRMAADGNDIRRDTRIEDDLSSRSSNNNNNNNNSNDNNDGIGVGIDLGTTNSAIAYLNDDGIPTIITIPNNGRTMPSVVTFTKNNSSDKNVSVLVGHDAIQHEITHAAGSGSVYRNVKRIIGTGGKLSRDIRTVVPFVHVNTMGKTYKKDNLQNQIYDGTEHPTLLQKVVVGGVSDDNNNTEFILPEEISSHIVKTLMHAAKQHLGRSITRAVIGVPAYFHDAQRTATQKAAQMAGIPKVKLLREPEAAALAYGVGRKQQLQQLQLQQQRNRNDNGGYNDDTSELVLVFDLGGGTYDVSMLIVEDGITEIISTSGNAQLGGSVFDGKIASYFASVIQSVEQQDKQHGTTTTTTTSTSRWSLSATNAMVVAAEAVRIYLSNHRSVHLALPLSEKAWVQRMNVASDIIIFPSSSSSSSGNSHPLNATTTTTTIMDSAADVPVSNSTHVLFQFTRKHMERLCKDEFQALLRPIREVAIMSGALLPGDSSPSIVASALDLDQEYSSNNNNNNNELVFDEFYTENSNGILVPSVDENDIDSDTLLALKSVGEMKDAKKAQQQGRKRARDVAKQERKYRQEKKKLGDRITTTNRGNPNKVSVDEKIKVRDGISGRPISRVVLVGGATRMPAIGRLLAALTGVVPQKTVNPDEAVALGCAVHVGVLDGVQGMGTVLNPMQAAILRAVARERGQQLSSKDVDGDDDDLFDEYDETTIIPLDSAEAKETTAT